MDYQFERPKEKKTEIKFINICNYCLRIIIYAMVFLLPLFFLPNTVDVFEFNKQYLIWVLTGVAVLIWWFRMIILEKKMTWKRTPLDIPILIFVATNVLIAMFSVDKYVSLWGSYGTFSQSLINVFTMAVLYFVVTNNF
ncbi:hypothetical protein ACFL23_03500 [Patescibacteria group bacterium]